MLINDHSRPPGLRALVYSQLPKGATPTDTACHPLSRRILERAGDDVIAVTTSKISDMFEGRPHIVIEIRDGDLDPAYDGELLGLLEQTNGGVVVYGVTYEEKAEPGTIDSTDSI